MPYSALTVTPPSGHSSSIKPLWLYVSIFLQIVLFCGTMVFSSNYFVWCFPPWAGLCCQTVTLYLQVKPQHAVMFLYQSFLAVLFSSAEILRKQSSVCIIDQPDSKMMNTSF